MTTASHFGLIASAFAVGLVVARRGKTIADFKEKIKSLKYVLFSCAIVLLFHTVDQAIWQFRASTLLANKDDAELVRQMAMSIGFNVAISYVCTLFAFHVPAVDAVMSQAVAPLKIAGVSKEQRSKWMLENKLSSSWLEFYAEVFAVLSPLVASFPLAKLFIALF